jgi:hypothetical protein
MLEPHEEQKTLAKPSGGSQERRRSSPWTMFSDPVASLACGEPEEPVRRWQRVQWHQLALSGGSATWKRTPPQLQPPVSGSGMTPV